MEETIKEMKESFVLWQRWVKKNSLMDAILADEDGVLPQSPDDEEIIIGVPDWPMDMPHGC